MIKYLKKLDSRVQRMLGIIAVILAACAVYYSGKIIGADLVGEGQQKIYSSAKPFKTTDKAQRT